MNPNRLMQQRQEILPSVPNKSMQRPVMSQGYPYPSKPNFQQNNSRSHQTYQNQQYAPAHNPHYQHAQPEPPRRIFLKWIIIILVAILMIGGAAYAGYYYANNYKKTSDSSASTAKSESADTSKQVALDNGASTNTETHFVVHAGYPYDLGGKKKFVISLGLPKIAQAVSNTSNNNNRGQEQYYTDKYNDEIARWEIGYPEQEQSPTSQISVLAISKSWLGLTQSNNHAFDDTAQKLDTPAEKQAYMQKIRNEGNSCVKDKAKGFTTTDKIFNVCFSLIPGIEEYDPTLVLRGYGEAEGQQILLVGFIKLEDGKNVDDATSKKLLADAKANKLPESTLQIIDTFIGSLKSTTLKVVTLQ